MFHFLKYRSQGVVTTSLYQNDCAIGGLNINVLENKFYYLQNNTLYVVDWVRNDGLAATVIYQSTNKLRNLIINHEFIGFIEEGVGLVLLETTLQTEFCKIPWIQEHFTFYDEYVLYNVGEEVFKKELIGREVEEHCFTTPYPITQLIEDANTIIVQMESNDFKQATKIVYDKENGWLETTGNNWRIMSTEGTRYYSKRYLQRLDCKEETRVTFYKDENVVPICDYVHETNSIICYEKSDQYNIVNAQNIDEVYAVLLTRPDWFAYLGDLIAYKSEDEIRFVKVESSDYFKSEFEAVELAKERTKARFMKMNAVQQLSLHAPIIDTPSPNHLIQFVLIGEDSVQLSLSEGTLPVLSSMKAHLDILTGYDISLITVYKIVENIEAQYPNTQFQWKVIHNHAIKENSALVYCTESSMWNEGFELFLENGLYKK